VDTLVMYTVRIVDIKETDARS